MGTTDTPGEDHGEGPAPQDASSRLSRVERVFFEIATLDPADREEALRSLCEGDASLEADVRSLMAAASRMGAFLEKPALGKDVEELTRESAGVEPPDELVGATLGSFRVVKRLASGGMGTIYFGERSDGQFEQDVAIKVVKRGMDSEEILRRFKDERQTLASLDHPNISRLIDGGVTPDGRPFLVMEFVDGVPIDRYCDEHRLKISERIALFRQVCDGVHHAHQNLVIHRDLKPSNILVSPQGVPKLLDFGIAKLLSGDGTAEVMTTDADRRLTPEYASPEQVEGRMVTTASDVYSLGVVLYELLTGTRPYHFALRTSEELRRVVCKIVPPPPSNAVTVRAARLRTGSGRVLSSAETPSVRPGTGTGVGSTPRTDVDIPKTRGVSSTRLRNVLRGDLDMIVMMALRKEPPRRYASAEQFSADLGRYLDGMPVQAQRDTVAYRASKFVRRHAVGVSLTIAAVVLLSAATVVLYRQSERLAAQRDELLASNASLEETRQYLVTILGGGDTGNYGPDVKLGTVLREASRDLGASPPGDPLTRAASEQALGRAVMSLGMLEEARALLESAERGFESLPEDSDALADVRVALAELLFFEGRYAEAERRFRELLAEERARSGGAHTALEGTLLNDLGASLRLQNKTEEAIAMQRQAIDARVAALGEGTLPVAESRNNLGSALFQSGDLEGAIREIGASLATRRSLLRGDHPLVIRCRSNLGFLQLRAGDVDEAVANLTECAEAWDRAFGPDHPGRVSTIISLSQGLRRQGNHEAALDWLNRALEWQRGRLAPDSAAIAATEANIGIVLAESGRDKEARALLERALPVLRSAGDGFAAITADASESLSALDRRGGGERRE